jgi:hypothetical protein
MGFHLGAAVNAVGRLAKKSRSGPTSGTKLGQDFCPVYAQFTSLLVKEQPHSIPDVGCYYLQQQSEATTLQTFFNT